MIAIIDYDAGNIKSVEKALQKLGQDVVITREKEQILAADKVILPGGYSSSGGKKDSLFGDLSWAAAFV